MAAWDRLELSTYCLEGSCSIRLSYQAKHAERKFV